MPETPPLGSPPPSPTAPVEPEPQRVAPETQRTEGGLPSSKRWLLIFVGLAVVGLAYGVGRVQGAMALGAAEERCEADRLAGEAKLSTCDRERSLLTARRDLSLVALALDRRNFGMAETHRRDALLVLEQPSLSAVAEASKIAARVRGLDLGVDPNPGTKRDQVVAEGEALDRLTGARPATAASTAAAP